jgi:hypothetical protein
MTLTTTGRATRSPSADKPEPGDGPGIFDVGQFTRRCGG